MSIERLTRECPDCHGDEYCAYHRGYECAMDDLTPPTDEAREAVENTRNAIALRASRNGLTTVMIPIATARTLISAAERGQGVCRWRWDSDSGTWGTPHGTHWLGVDSHAPCGYAHCPDCGKRVEVE